MLPETIARTEERFDKGAEVGRGPAFLRCWPPITATDDRASLRFAADSVSIYQPRVGRSTCIRVTSCFDLRKQSYRCAYDMLPPTVMHMYFGPELPRVVSAIFARVISLPLYIGRYEGRGSVLYDNSLHERVPSPIFSFFPLLNRRNFSLVHLRDNNSTTRYQIRKRMKHDRRPSLV